MRTPKHITDANRAAGYTRERIGAPYEPHPRQKTTRVAYGERQILLQGWPSRGGLIVLERAGIVEFEYLGLDRFNPPDNRAGDQDEEDEFCRQLLRLGAIWFDSHRRFTFVASLMEDYERRGPELLAVMAGEKPPPSERECRWTCVGIEGDGPGFWLLECQPDIPHPIQTFYDEIPDDAPRLALAKTMEERCRMLKDMGAKFYPSIREYEGLASVNAWETRKGPEHAGWRKLEEQTAQEVVPEHPPEPKSIVGNILTYLTGV